MYNIYLDIFLFSFRLFSIAIWFATYTKRRADERIVDYFFFFLSFSTHFDAIVVWGIRLAPQFHRALHGTFQIGDRHTLGNHSMSDVRRQHHLITVLAAVANLRNHTTHLIVEQFQIVVEQPQIVIQHGRGGRRQTSAGRRLRQSTMRFRQHLIRLGGQRFRRRHSVLVVDDNLTDGFAVVLALLERRLLILLDDDALRATLDGRRDLVLSFHVVAGLLLRAVLVQDSLQNGVAAE